MYEINDKRNPNDFKGITFSKFKKSQVKKELIGAIDSGKVEPACYWSAEYICAGHYSDLWEIIILFISRHIHLGNPKIPIYIAARFDNFKSILTDGYIDNELQLRNNPKIRSIFAEIVTILCMSRKKHTFDPVKIKKEEEFNMAFIASKLKAPKLEYASAIFKSGDPKELFIAINELAYHISTKNAVNACYWLEWALEYETICSRKKDKCECERRTFAPVFEKYQKDPIWIIWDLLLNECKKKENTLLTRIFESLIAIFSIKYTNGVKRRRRFVIYFAISLLTEIVDYNMEMIPNKNQIDNIKSKIDFVYKEVKKNEVSPQTDYLLTNVKQMSNLDKTIERLEKFKQLSI